MQKVKDLTSLEKFSKLYKDYKILNFEGGDLNKKDYDHNLKLMVECLKHILPVLDEFDDTVPTTQITMQVVVEGFVEEQKFIDVQLNLKRWQEVAKLTDGSAQLQGMLKSLTGFN